MFNLTVSHQQTWRSWRKNCVGATQREISSPLLRWMTGLSFTHIHEALPPLMCYLCVMISALSYSGWEWLMLLQHHALALGVPHGSYTGPRFVTVGFTGCSGGTVELITGCDFHCFIQSFITIQMTRNMETLMRIFWVRGQGQCACVSTRECVCVWGGFVFIGYVLICLSGRVAGFLPRWSSGFSSAWWTSSVPASPWASPRSEAAPPGSQLDGHTNTQQQAKREKETKEEIDRKTNRKQEIY